jgi:predicted CoA-binding protein
MSSSEVVCEIPACDPLPEDIKSILESAKTIAIVGLSPKRDRMSHNVAKYLKFQGYNIIPINPTQDSILGLKSYPDVNAIPENIEVDVVDIFRKSEAVPEIVDGAIKRGVKVVWMQEGVIHNEAAQKALDTGIKVVMNRCMMKEHRKMMKNEE